MNETEKQRAIEILKKIMELELAGVVRYTHCALMVFGYDRNPIVSWKKATATRALHMLIKRANPGLILNSQQIA